MTTAADAMGRAVVSLEALKTAGALPPEMEALNHLLKAQADIKRRQLSTNQSAGSAGTGHPAQRAGPTARRSRRCASATPLCSRDAGCQT